MSNFIKGEALLLYVHNGTAYQPVACLTSNSLSQTRNIIESQTKCDPGLIIKDAGSLTYEVSFEGLYIDTTSVGTQVNSASHDKLFIQMNGGTTQNWKMDTGLADTPSYFGEGIFSDLSLDAPAGDELATFSGTLNGSGEIVTTDPVV